MSMFGGNGQPAKEMLRLKESHKRYLETYKKLNNGSLAGATSFADYYVYRTFTAKYGDPRACAPVGYR